MTAKSMSFALAGTVVTGISVAIDIAAIASGFRNLLDPDHDQPGRDLWAIRRRDSGVSAGDGHAGLRPVRWTGRREYPRLVANRRRPRLFQ